ncbi:MAG: tripartite tricarboxylate transporter substrate binding protein [Bacteroides thetaiotaomicron]|nr:tripartite tricarboxylate transporter substrate binding protein [Bacteroides thetaiotaomicron]
MDTMARTIATYIDLDGQTAYVTNIEGSGSAVAGMEFYHRDPDGMSFYVSSPESQASNYCNGALTENLNADCVPVASMCYDCNVICVGANSPYETIEDLMEAAAANPGEITLASISLGSYMHTSALGLMKITGLDFNYVPYDSATKSRTAVIGGNEDVLWCQISEAKSYVESGDLRILATTTMERTEYYPDIPTMTELGYECEMGLHRSFWLPAGTPDEIVDYYNKALYEVFCNEEFSGIISDLGYVLMYNDPDEMKDIVANVQAEIEELLQQ